MGERGPERTNVTRFLESRGIAHRVAVYEVDLSDLSATHAAEKVGLPAEQVFKTLALRGPKGGPFLCCVPSDAEVDLRKAAKAAGEKSVEMLPLKELSAATGYLRGGCSPIGTKRAYPVYIDETAQLFEEISVSAGEPGRARAGRAVERAGRKGELRGHRVTGARLRKDLAVSPAYVPFTASETCDIVCAYINNSGGTDALPSLRFSARSHSPHGPSSPLRPLV